MSWFLSIMLVGAVLTSGTNLPTYEYQNTTANNPKTVKKINTDETEKFEQTYQFDPNGKIEVSNLNGSIYIEAWDRPEIYLQATKVADVKERLSEVQIEIEESRNNFRVKTDYKAWKKRTNKVYQSNNKYKKYGKLYVTFRIKVPRTALLDSIETVNGSVTVSNMTNYTAVSAVNGSVKASNLRGTAKLSTVNGTVYADFDDLEDSSLISLETVNGSVKLNIPSSANATLKASTVNGSISNEFRLPIRKGKYVGRDLYGRIGNGNVKIKLSSVNGGLSINNKDGGTTNPAVNLLKQKTSDDFDDSFDTQMNINIEKMNTQINTAVAKAQNAATIVRGESKAEQEKRIQRNAQRNAERTQRRAERDAARKIERAERDAERERRKTKIDTEKIKEIEAETERIEEDMMRATEALYLNRRSPFIQEKTGSLEVVGIPKVVIDADDCDISIRGWDKQEVRYTISRMTKTGNRTNELRTKISSNKSEVEIQVTNDTPTNTTSNKMLNRVRVEVFVPKKSNLKVSSEQEIRLEGVSGELELNGNDESINIRDSAGRLKAETVDGTIRVIGFKGEIETIAVDGDIYLEGMFKRIRSESNQGSVYLTLPDEVNATLITNGEVDIENVQVENVINVNKDNRKTINIGKGGLKYNFNFGEGKLIIRSKSSLSD